MRVPQGWEGWVFLCRRLPRRRVLRLAVSHAADAQGSEERTWGYPAGLTVVARLHPFPGCTACLSGALGAQRQRGPLSDAPAHLTPRVINPSSTGACGLSALALWRYSGRVGVVTRAEPRLLPGETLTRQGRA